MESMNVPERLLTIEVLPKSGNFIAMEIVRGIIKKLSLSPADMISYDIVISDGGNVKWNNKGNEPSEFDLQPIEISFIQKALRDLDAKEALNQETLPIYEKFLKRV